MQFFLVTLRDSPRLAGTLSALRAYGIEPEVVYGVRGARLPPERVDEITFRHPLRDLALRRLVPGELGCALSHFLVMNRIVARGIPRAFVLEDDVRFTQDPRPIIAELDAWAAGRSNFLLNWGGQRDPRFALPISKEVHRRASPPFSIRQFPDMLWGTYCLLVDREYCVERLRKAFPLLYILDVYGVLGLRSSFYVLEEPTPTCDPDLVPSSTASTIEPRKPSLASRLFPRNTMSRFRLEQLRNGVVRRLAADRFWSLERTQAYLERLEEAGARELVAGGRR